MQKQTVKIYLAEGNLTGLRSLELFNWNGENGVSHHLIKKWENRVSHGFIRKSMS
jgi:hypothetical protein